MILDGKAIADQIQQEICDEVSLIQGRKPCLSVVLVGEHPASRMYVNRKAQACKKVGIHSVKVELPAETTEKELIHAVEELNANPDVDGILVQFPLPSHINSSKVVQSILPEKDVDGFHPVNVGKMMMGESDGFFSCTPLGIKVLLERSGIDVAGRHVVVIGRSNIVGKPMAVMLMQRAVGGRGGDATVTVLHSRSQNFQAICRLADVVIVAIGKPRFLTGDMVKEGVVIVDVGINKIEDLSHPNGYRIVGDVDVESVKDKCSFMTPVPGGVGPMTIAMLLSNTLESYRRRVNEF